MPTLPSLGKLDKVLWNSQVFTHQAGPQALRVCARQQTFLLTLCLPGGLGQAKEQVGPWAGCLGGVGPWLGEAQIPQADKAACKHPASGRGQRAGYQMAREGGNWSSGLATGSGV